jgi:hypothetical protein
MTDFNQLKKMILEGLHPNWRNEDFFYQPPVFVPTSSSKATESRHAPSQNDSWRSTSTPADTPQEPQRKPKKQPKEAKPKKKETTHSALDAEQDPQSSSELQQNKFEVSQLCLAKYSRDNKYYPAQIVFVKDGLYPIHKSDLLTPSQIHGKLHSIQ